MLNVLMKDRVVDANFKQRKTICMSARKGLGNVICTYVSRV